MPLKYPLHYYDEAGRLKPPLFIYIFLLFVCRGLLILAISLSFREDKESLLRLFYPQVYQFYLSLLPLLPAIYALYLVSHRNKIWANNNYQYYRRLKPFMALALLIDASIQFYILARLQFSFSMSHGLAIAMAILGLMYILRSSHLKNLIKDWSSP